MDMGSKWGRAMGWSPEVPNKTFARARVREIY